MLAGLVAGNSWLTRPTVSTGSVGGPSSASFSSIWQRGPTMPSAMMPMPACQRRIAASKPSSIDGPVLPSTGKSAASGPSSAASAFARRVTSGPDAPLEIKSFMGSSGVVEAAGPVSCGGDLRPSHM